MATRTAHQIIEQLNHVTKLDDCLLLVAAPSGSGKTTALRDVAARPSAVPLSKAKQFLESFQAFSSLGKMKKHFEDYLD
ncbi:MAG: hypothetical protein ACE5JX_18005 [Acidobacteriota bacterium]